MLSRANLCPIEPSQGVFQDATIGAREMAQTVKCLPHRTSYLEENLKYFSDTTVAMVRDVGNLF